MHGLPAGGRDDFRGHGQREERNSREQRSPRERGADHVGRDAPSDPLAEIRQRQRALNADRNRMAGRDEPLPRREPPPREPPLREPARRSYDVQHEMRRNALSTPPLPRREAPAPRAMAPAAPPAPRMPPAPQPDIATREITQALISLRQDLKKDISEGFAREISSLRNEMRAIKGIAETRQGNEDFRNDLNRLAEGIRQLGDRPREGTEGLKAEFEELRSLMDGLAREESVRDIDTRWSSIADQLQPQSHDDLRESMATLSDRLDTIREQIGSIGDNRSVRMLEDKLATVAQALERIGAQFDPQERAITQHFSGLDMRLEEISRTIANGLRSQASAMDQQVIDRLEDRLGAISQQIDALTEHAATRDDPVNELGHRIETLSARIEDLAHEQAASRLDERIEQLSLMVEEAQRPVDYPELTGFLSDISRKIDALEHGDVNERLAERFDELARRIDSLEIPAPVAQVAPIDDRLLRGLEERLNDIAYRIEDGNRAAADPALIRGLEARLNDIAFQLEDSRRQAADPVALRSLEQRLDAIAGRLEETHARPATDDQAALRGLEEQIASLTAHLNSGPREARPDDPAVTGRLAALEDYMAASDEYIIEAARQAAEAVMETYAQQRGGTSSTAHSGEMETLAALASNLKHLEELSRGSEERTARTIEALQGTLQQIASRLDTFERPAPLAAAASPSPAGRETLAQMAAAKLAEQQPASRAMPATPDDEIEADLGRLTGSRSVLLDDLISHEPRAAKPSLLAGLSRRLTGQRKDENPVTSRPMVDPAPSLDPGDMLPPDEANELLEPGSGAPDIRRILERVRASQSAQRGRAEEDGPDEDRTDYIAAARRAAQAAAEEMERGSRGTGQQEQLPANGKGASLLSRYRRPILMAVGAVLLVVMALPLANTLIRGQKAPQPVIETSTAPKIAPTANHDPATMAAAPATEAAPIEQAQPALAPPSRDVTPPAREAAAPEMAAASMPPENSTPDAPDAVPQIQAETATDGIAQPAGIAVPDDIKPASLSVAAKNGDPQALFEIGARYTEGRGVKADLANAAKWYQLAADRGFAPALYRLANLYEKGSGVERNLATAKRYYQMAADRGNASAMHNLAVLFASGADGKQDYAEAAKWFTGAAELGVTDSQFNLAILYARGNGVKQDLEASYKWFAIAAKDGDKDAAQKRDEVANSMRPEQLEKAKASAESWTAAPLDVDANSVNPPDEWAGTALKTASVDMKKAVQNIQAILNRNGYDAGTPDGVMGKKTVLAIKAFQSAVGQEPTGVVTDQLVKELLARNK